MHIADFIISFLFFWHTWPAFFACFPFFFPTLFLSLLSLFYLHAISCSLHYSFSIQLTKHLTLIHSFSCYWLLVLFIDLFFSHACVHYRPVYALLYLFSFAVIVFSCYIYIYIFISVLSTLKTAENQLLVMYWYSANTLDSFLLFFFTSFSLPFSLSFLLLFACLIKFVSAQ